MIPQIIMLSLAFTRVLFASLKATGVVEIPRRRPMSPFVDFASSIVVIAILQGLLWWGGFYDEIFGRASG